MWSTRRFSLLRSGASYCFFLSLCAIALLSHPWTTTHLFSKKPLDAPPEQAQPPPNPSIPKIIWYKLSQEGLKPEIEEWTQTCMSANPSYDIQFLTDEDAADFVNTAFANRTDILYMYFGLTVPSLRHDLLRYLLLYDQGGVWFELGTSCSEIPIDEWIPEQYADDTGLVVGRETDAGWRPGTRRRFASWVLMAKPESPHLLTVVENLVEALQQTMQFYDVDIEDVTLAMTGDAIAFSGPGRLTSGVVKSLEVMLDRDVEPEEVSSVLLPNLIGDVLIMPRRSFAVQAYHYSVDEEAFPPTLATYHKIRAHEDTDSTEEAALEWLVGK